MSKMNALEAERQIFELVQFVYEAAINAEVRVAFVYALCQALGLDVTHRHIITTDNTILDICHNDPASVDCFFPGDEELRESNLPGGGSIQTTSRLFLQADLIGSSFFGEWLKPPHEDRGAIVLLERCGEVYDFGLFYRTVGNYDPRQIQATLDVLKPHCLAVAQLMRVTQQLELQRQALQAALDRAPFGLVLLDSSGAVTECNGTAQAILDGSLGLKLAKNRGLESSIRCEQSTLDAILGRGLQLSRNQTIEAAGAATLARPGQNSRLEVIAWPAMQNLSASLPSSSAVALFIRDPITQQSTLDISYDELKTRYRLSKAEAITFNLLRKGLSPSEIASQLGVSDSTINQRVRGILHKTKAKRVQDIILADFF